jgi:hypothetical protein
MFSRISRYSSLPDIVTTDAKGRTLLSKTLRPLPQVAGTFRHTVEDGDRLDHLAYKYYRQPRQWWRLSDANPEFLSPQALLGKEPIVVDRFTLELQGSRPPWPALLQNLTQRVGVEKVVSVEEVRLVARTQIIGGRSVTLQVEQFERAIVVTYNRLNVSSAELAGIIAASGFGVLPPERLGQAGRQIIVPRNVTG